MLSEGLLLSKQGCVDPTNTEQIGEGKGGKHTRVDLMKFMEEYYCTVARVIEARQELLDR